MIRYGQIYAYMDRKEGKMNILILNGSPRPDGNTSAFVEAFTEGAESAGHKVKTVPVGNKMINGCLACEYCHTKGDGQCVQKDDMAEIYEAMKDTEMLLLASPVYYWSWSGQLQSAVSRFYTTGTINVKKSALILSSESPDVYDAPISQYHSILEYSGTQDMGVFTFHGEENKSKDALEKIRELGAGL